MKGGSVRMGSIGRGLFCIGVLALALALLSACARSTTTNRRVAPARQEPAETLRALHDKIVYAVQESSEATGMSAETYHLYWVDPAENKPHLLLSAKNPATEELTTFYLPGREKMLVHMAVPGNTKTGNDYVADIDGANPKLLVRGHVSDIFPDGKHVLISSDLSEGPQSLFLYSADLHGNIVKRLSFRPKGVERKSGPDYLYEGDTGGHVSPDAKFIVYGSSWYSQGIGDEDIVRVDSDGSNPRRLTDGQKTRTDFSVGDFSHAGSTLAVVKTTSSDTSETKSSLALMDISGRVLAEHVLGESGVFGGWSPRDDQVVLFSAHTIDLLDVKTGRSTTVVRLDSTADSAITSVSWLE